MYHDFPKTAEDYVVVWARIVSFIRWNTCVDRHRTFACSFSPLSHPHKINSNAWHGTLCSVNIFMIFRHDSCLVCFGGQ